MDLLSEETEEAEGEDETRRIKPRRRARLRTNAFSSNASDLRSAADFVADPNRFSGLDDRWFWIDEFQISVKRSWAEEHAEDVFRRRQESKLPLAKLVKEFGKSRPTIKRAIDIYLAEHPDAKDEVKLPCGGKRPKKFRIEEFGDEARRLWVEENWSKLRLATKYKCSPPTIDKALEYAYA